MRIGSKFSVIIVFILVLVSACASNGTEETGQGEVNVDGPALVMFYTDN